MPSDHDFFRSFAISANWVRAARHGEQALEVFDDARIRPLQFPVSQSFNLSAFSPNCVDSKL
jgi:hypothetical protein